MIINSNSKPSFSIQPNCSSVALPSPTKKLSKWSRNPLSQAKTKKLISLPKPKTSSFFITTVVPFSHLFWSISLKFSLAKLPNGLINGNNKRKKSSSIQKLFPPKWRMNSPNFSINMLLNAMQLFVKLVKSSKNINRD